MQKLLKIKKWVINKIKMFFLFLGSSFLSTNAIAFMILSLSIQDFRVY